MAHYKCPTCEMALGSTEFYNGFCPGCFGSTRWDGRLPVWQRGAELRRGLWDDPGPKSPPDLTARGWSTVKTGLLLIFLAALVLLVGAGVVWLSTFDRRVTVRAIWGGRLPQWMLYFSVWLMAAGFLDMTGRFLCCAAPRKSGARGFAFGMILCLLIAPLVLILAIYFSSFSPTLVSSGRMPTGLVFTLGGAVLLLAGNSLFLLFLWKTAKFFGNTLLARGCMRHLLFTGLFIGGVIAANISVRAALALSTLRFSRWRLVSAYALVGGLTVCGLLLVIWYIRLIKQTRDTIRLGASLDPPPRADEY